MLIKNINNYYANVWELSGKNKHFKHYFSKNLEKQTITYFKEKFLVCARARTYARVYIKYNNILYYITYSI